MPAPREVGSPLTRPGLRVGDDLREETRPALMSLKDLHDMGPLTLLVGDDLREEARPALMSLQDLHDVALLTLLVGDDLRKDPRLALLSVEESPQPLRISDNFSRMGLPDAPRGGQNCTDFFRSGIDRRPAADRMELIAASVPALFPFTQEATGIHVVGCPGA